MRYVTALFDAPMPALLSLRLLREAGFEDRDLALLPSIPAHPRPVGLLGDLEERRPEEVLRELGLPGPTLTLALEGLRRGALVVLAQVPDLAAPAARRAMDSAGALPPEATARSWAARPELRYRWAEIEAPEILLAEEAQSDSDL